MADSSLTAPELGVEQIKTALKNALSMDQQLRDGAYQYLMKKCEPNPQFQILLLHIIKTAGFSQGSQVPSPSPTPDQIQIQYQAILCMKSSLTRLLQNHRCRNFEPRNSDKSKPSQPGVKTVSFSGLVPNQKRLVITEELRNRIKQELLDLIIAPDGVILSKNSYDQLTLVVTIFIKYDFPANWPQMNQWLLKNLEQLFNNMHSLNMEDVPFVQRFLGFYHEVLKEQSKKQLTNTKSQFIKVAKDHMKTIGGIWQFFNEQQKNMIFDSDKNRVFLQPYNESLFAIASKLDKILLLIVKCGFSVHNLLTQPENNTFVETVGLLINKLQLFVECADQTSLVDFAEKAKFMGIFIQQIKTFLRRLSELQASENLLMYNNIDKYLMILARLLFRSEIYPVRINKLTLIAIYKVVNTDVYNAEREVSGHHDGIGMIVSPVKFKNLEPQIEIARNLFHKVMDLPDSPDDTTKQDGARKIIELVTYKFLSQVDLSSWQSDPEFFIENEDEQLMLEYDLQDDSSLNLLAQHLIQKLLQKFYTILYPFIEHILDQYIQGQFPGLTVQVQDALLNLAGIVGKVQREHKIKPEKRLNISRVLDFITTHKWSAAEETPIFKRRYLLILTHWVKIMPKNIFLQQFQTVCESLRLMGTVNQETGELQHLTSLEKVLVYEHSQCIHELVKDITNRIRSAEEREKHGGLSFMHGQLPKDIEELRGGGPRIVYSDTEEDQIAYSLQINSQINYAKLCQLICSKLMPLFNSFKAPNLIWTMINDLLTILEQTVSQPEMIGECFRYFNLLSILQQDAQNHIYEAVIDMLKNLLIICPSSPVILTLCCDLLDYKLSQSLNDGNTVAFWLFTMRAVDDHNPVLPRLKQVFLKYSGCLTHKVVQSAPSSPLVIVPSIKRDYIYQELLQVAQEGVLLGMFDFGEITQLIQFATFKLESELQAEKTGESRDMETAQIDDKSFSSGSDDERLQEGGAYEKKANLILLQQIIYCKLEKEHGDAVLNGQKTFLVLCCAYLIESRATLTLQCSQVLFQQLVAYISRVIVVKQAIFVDAVLIGELGSKGYTMAQFMEALLNKMEHVVSWEGQRMKTLTLLTLLPLLSAEIIRDHFASICRQMLHRLEDELYLKLSKEKTLTTYSPSRFKLMSDRDMKNRPNAVKIRLHEYSQRYESVKREDWPLEFDQVEIFWAKIQELMAKLQLQTIEPLVECLPDELRQSFVNLVNGFSPKYESRRKDEEQTGLQMYPGPGQVQPGTGSLLQQFVAGSHGHLS